MKPSVLNTSTSSTPCLIVVEPVIIKSFSLTSKSPCFSISASNSFINSDTFVLKPPPNNGMHMDKNAKAFLPVMPSVSPLIGLKYKYVTKRVF